MSRLFWRFILLLRPPPRPTLFPYTTLFRSVIGVRQRADLHHGRSRTFRTEDFLTNRAELGAVAHVRDVRVDLHHIVQRATAGDRKSTRLNSSHGSISYAVFCLKKKTVEANG